MKHVYIALLLLLMLTNTNVTDNQLEEEEIQYTNDNAIVVNEYREPKKTLLEKRIAMDQDKIQVDEMPRYDIPLDIELQRYIYGLCKEHSLEYELVLALIKTESNFNPSLVYKNKNGSRDNGLAQINSIHKETFKELGFTDMLDPYENVAYGVYLLAALFEKYEDEHMVLMSYNFGISQAKKLYNKGIYSSKYSRKVVAMKEEFKEYKNKDKENT